MKPVKNADTAWAGPVWGVIAGAIAAATGSATALQQALQTLHVSAPTLSMLNLPGWGFSVDAG